MVCLAKTASTHEAFVTAGHFLVNVLACEQSEVAVRFARSGGDHSILIGKVAEVSTGEPDPLVHCDRTFAQPVPLPRLAPAR